MGFSDHLIDDYLKYTFNALESMDALLDELRSAARGNDVLSKEIFALAHNIKGMGGSFGFDLMSAAGNSLCYYFRSLPHDTKTKADIVEAHLKVMHTILENKILGDGGESGQRLISRLEELVAKELN